MVTGMDDSDLRLCAVAEEFVKFGKLLFNLARKESLIPVFLAVMLTFIVSTPFAIVYKIFRLSPFLFC